jgi:hypothetical protein
MKNLLIAFIMMISISSFAQDGCTASITKLTGDAFLKKVEIKRMHKIDLNKDCKYKVLSFSVEFTTTKREYHQYDLPGDEIPDKVNKEMQMADKTIKFSKILIGTGLKKDEPIALPDINLTLTK